jgi:predicted dehydrogenase
MKPVTVAIIGAGGRGQGYAAYCMEHPNEGKVVAVAEPVEVRREKIAKAHKLAAGMVFSDWKELAKKRKVADAVVIGTQDRMHTGPAVAFAEKGYHVLLEKPMAPTAAECRKIVKAAKDAGVVFAVGHVMRYSPYFKKMKELIDAGAVGEIATVQHLEPVGYWHQAHSFVRGHWRNSKQSSSMLLAKSCHDIDILRYFIGKRCLAVSSFGSLKHFRKEAKPARAGMRCVACGIEPECPYSALKIYLTDMHPDWVRFALGEDQSPEGLRRAIETGPYGRCVYECDNDVVDHQVVNFLYEDGITAVFTMTAFTRHGGRETRVMGTMGELVGDRKVITHNDFRTNKTTVYDPAADAGGHGGGDEGLMKDFLAACVENDPTMISSGPEVSLETHLTVFAAEKARVKGTVEKVPHVR